MITLKQNRLTVTDLVITDSDILRFFDEVQADDEQALQREYEALLLRALKIGVTALQRAETRVDLDAVRREFDAWQTQVLDAVRRESDNWQTQMQSALDDIFKEDQGKLALALSNYLGEGGELADLFDPDRKESAIGRIQAIFDEHFKGDGARFAHLLDYTESDSPLKKLHEAFEQKFKDMDQKLTELGERLAGEKARLEEREKAPGKGFDFEELLLPVLDRAARPYQDVVEQVGAEAADDRIKKGDFVIELNNQDTDGQNARIVVEAKRRRTALTGRTGILLEMEEAMTNRNAQFAIAVFSDDVCPNNIGRLRLYPNHRIICSIASDGSDSLALEIAYQLARSQLCWHLRHHGQEIDRVKVTQAVKSVSEKLDQFKGLKQNTTSLIKTARGIRRQLDAVEYEIRSAIGGILAELDAP